MRSICNSKIKMKSEWTSLVSGFHFEVNVSTSQVDGLNQATRMRNLDKVIGWDTSLNIQSFPAYFLGLIILIWKMICIQIFQKHLLVSY